MQISLRVPAISHMIKAVFNYDFGSVSKESPVVKAVYRVLREAEHRSSSFIPYWNLPYADQWMGGQREFRADMTMLDDILAKLINEAVMTRQEATVEELEERENEDDPSLLRFLVDMRGEDLSSMTLRDDLMTMLIAGHETTAGKFFCSIQTFVSSTSTANRIGSYVDMDII